MATLASLVAITKIVSRDALEKAVLSRVPKGTEELNKKPWHKASQLLNK